MRAIITSTKDPAGLNIRENLLMLADWCEAGSYDGNPVFSYKDAKLFLTETDSIHCERIDEQIPADLFIFATKHKSSAGKPSLSVHAPGNWSAAKLGGRDRKLCIAPPEYIYAAYMSLLKLNDTGHEVTVEQTHHGPLIDKPCFFIEIGSSVDQWKDEALGKIIAKAVLGLIDEPPKARRSAMVLGSGHYSHAANKVMERAGIAVGHICAKFLLGELTSDMLRYAAERHTSRPEMIILDWKGLGGHKEHIKRITAEAGIETVRLKQILNSC